MRKIATAGAESSTPPRPANHGEAEPVWESLEAFARGGMQRLMLTGVSKSLTGSAPGAHVPWALWRNPLAHGVSTGVNPIPVLTPGGRADGALVWGVQCLNVPPQRSSRWPPFATNSYQSASRSPS